ncbi:tryptophan synthase subunit alpha [Clostridium estertheticum]|uniref:tryptophan synthase subunit alpha n=1 Tax=Clostridium estertheticum TaxID=238834 RepID=UPI001C6F5379|nr:tryptophan synthase subunit alpha [Clostridium estertheticum]MBW9152557.1 tryptophan synthase subunit alpha [Clostridium estertheticum]WLC85926.1 tryptophan synthase subunit alpha [Clostridium estertheticum]
MNRIVEKFNYLKSKNEKAFIPFITGGDPDLDTTLELVLTLEKAGADIIEIGVPYSDPMADGPVIQASSTRSLANGTKIKSIMDKVREIREKTQIPLVYLLYYNSIFKYGDIEFFKKCKEVGIDGLIIPDLPLEERAEVIKIADKYDVCIIPMVAPTSKSRIKAITNLGKGFVYCVSVNGVTGTRQKLNTDIKEYMDLVSMYTDMPKGLGFGISNAEMAKAYAPYCEAIIVGSAIIKLVAEGGSRTEILKRVYDFALGIKNAIN